MSPLACRPVAAGPSAWFWVVQPGSLARIGRFAALQTLPTPADYRLTLNLRLDGLANAASVLRALGRDSEARNLATQHTPFLTTTPVADALVASIILNPRNNSAMP